MPSPEGDKIAYISDFGRHVMVTGSGGGPGTQISPASDAPNCDTEWRNAFPVLRPFFDPQSMQANVGSNFTVIFKVRNIGDGAAFSLMPNPSELTVSPIAGGGQSGGAISLINGPSPGTRAILDPGGIGQFLYTFRGDAPGFVDYRATVKAQHIFDGLA